MTVFLTALIYTISIVPLTVYYLAEPYVKKKPGIPGPFYTIFFSISMAFLNLNTVANFFIYALTVTSFRSFLIVNIRRVFPCGTTGEHQERKLPRDDTPGIRTKNRAIRSNLARACDNTGN